MAIARTNTYIWVTWLAKMMSGQQACDFSAWFKSHYQYDKLPTDFDVGAWTIQHARLLRELRIERLQAHETVYLGTSNSFSYQVRPGVTLAGRPDLVGDDLVGSPVVYAAKTGLAKTSDWIEVLICMHVLPLAVERYRGIQLRGCVVYPDRRIHIPESAVGPEFVSNFEYFVDVLAGETAPSKAPSEAECRSCNIGAVDCPERWGGGSRAAKLA
jgi:hypothetical protein